MLAGGAGLSEFTGQLVWSGWVILWEVAAGLSARALFGNATVHYLHSFRSSPLTFRYNASRLARSYCIYQLIRVVVQTSQ